MKKLVTFLLLFSCFSFGTFALKNQKVAKDSIIFVNTTNDYGTIEQGSPGKCEFKFTNTMKTPLVLSNVRASCGCTTPEWPKAPIAPGKTGVIKVVYNTKITGTFAKTITVNSNAKNATVVLRIKGTVSPSK